MVHPSDVIVDTPEQRVLNKLHDMTNRQRAELKELAQELLDVRKAEQHEVTNMVASDAAENLTELTTKLNAQIRRNVARGTLEVTGLYAELPYPIRQELKRVEAGALDGEVPALIVVPRRELSGRHPEKAYAIIDVSDEVLRLS